MYSNNKVSFKCVGRGVLRATIITLAAIILYSAITTLVDDNESVKSMVFMIISCISVLYGAVYAAKKAGRNGWINGMMVGIIYCVVIYIISLLAGRETAFCLSDLVRLVFATAVGTLSGMIGINL